MNQNGLTDSDELYSAAEAGLESISLDYISQDVYKNGNLLGEVSNTIFRGQEVTATDVYFRYKENSQGAPKSEVQQSVEPLLTAMSTFYTSASTSHSVLQARNDPANFGVSQATITSTLSDRVF
ncbi:hypothetical protein [Xylophilus ampelinus]|uniref:hypothetical protein n=1 Tax=Xylophilus ampelinus TaxID=54067 RepID=UPI0011B46DE0|nr:hypothetical protein [Xylophilus ampelinus]MCS4511901.1 hypothetical protein [Xylophilus ampelinus]